MREKSTSKNFLRFRKIIYSFLNNDSPLQYSIFKDKNLQIAALFASSTMLLKSLSELKRMPGNNHANMRNGRKSVGNK
jgi:hypothetical protein